MNIFVCDCIENEYPDIRLLHSVGRILTVDFNRRYIKIFYNDNLYVVCPEIIDFCYQVNRNFMFGNLCHFKEPHDSIFSCVSSLKFGLKSICPICIKAFSKKLLKHLSQL